MIRSAVPFRVPAVVLGLALALLAAGCRREQPDAEVGGPDPAAQAQGPAEAGRPRLEDVVEATPDYIVGISYPRSASRHPGLAVELRRYAEQARRELLDAVKQRTDAPAAAPYDLTLGFTDLVETPTIVAVAADGSRYTGGAHSEPLIARFVWLPREQRLLTSAELVPAAGDWEPIARVVREQLRAATRQRLEADGVPGDEREQYLAHAAQIIQEGTRPDAAHFSTFEPIMDGDGRMSGLRFVFPPYQVGPYADGTQTVDVPASVLLPHVAPQYRALFAGGAGTA